jgi:hypothetical protein
MRAALLLMLVACGSLTASACHKQQPENLADNQDISIESNLASGQLPANAEIETLPPDESSGTSSRELNAGEDNPDVNDLNNSD